MNPSGFNYGNQANTYQNTFSFDSNNNGGFNGNSEGMNQEPNLVDDDESDAPKVRRGGRRKIDIEYIKDKSRRHITFSKRKAGIMKKAYELSTLTGTQVLLLVVSETGLVYTFTTPKLQPLVTNTEGKNLIQSCLNSPDDPKDENESGGENEGGNDSEPESEQPPPSYKRESSTNKRQKSQKKDESSQPETNNKRGPSDSNYYGQGYGNTDSVAQVPSAAPTDYLNLNMNLNSQYPNNPPPSDAASLDYTGQYQPPPSSNNHYQPPPSNNHYQPPPPSTGQYNNTNGNYSANQNGYSQPPSSYNQPPQYSQQYPPSNPPPSQGQQPPYNNNHYQPNNHQSQPPYNSNNGPPPPQSGNPPYQPNTYNNQPPPAGPYNPPQNYNNPPNSYQPPNYNSNNYSHPVGYNNNNNS